MEAAIFKHIADFGVMVVLAGAFIYDSMTTKKVHTKFLEQIALSTAENSKLLDAIRVGQDNLGSTLDIIKSQTDRNYGAIAGIKDVTEETLDKVLCIKEKSGFLSPIETIKTKRKARHGSK